MTYPVIGNYGISDDDFETPRAAGRRPGGARLQRPALQLPLHAHAGGGAGGQPHPRHLRSGHAPASTRLIRDGGSRRALLTDADTPVEKALGAPRRNARAAATRWSASPAKSAGTTAPPTTASTWWRSICGIKLSVVRSLKRPRLQRNRGAVEHLRRSQILAMKPDGVLLLRRPGRPAATLPETIETGARPARTSCPSSASALGHQVVALAYGARVYKLKSGHHGGNHPVQAVWRRASVEPSPAQNHNYAVDADSLARHRPAHYARGHTGRHRGGRATAKQTACSPPSTARRARPARQDGDTRFDRFVHSS